MSGFLQVPENLLTGSIFSQFIVEQHSVRLDFTNEVWILTQSLIQQDLSGGISKTYDVEDRSSSLLLNQYLGCATSDNIDIRDERMCVRFDNGQEIVLHLPEPRIYDAITIFVDGRLEYIVR